ncbi:MAG: Type 1 glutamine amidotransferase-like domain-containing protein [Vicinamibacterales bacterium]
MERRDFLKSSVAGTVGAGLAGAPLGAAAREAGTAQTGGPRRILIAGGGFGTAFIRYMALLTGKPRPKLLYLPTASADSPQGIISWYKACAPLNVEPSHQISFIASTQQPRGWDEVLLSVDGIVCSGGNTLNQQVIWKAHGIDAILRQAWDKGIVLGGASAGSLCWFEEGTTDSRPKELSTVECLGFLKGSHCPHYDAEPGRRPLYHKLIGSGQMKPGYACCNDAGIYFEDNTVKRVVHTRAEADVFYVSVEAGKVVEKKLPAERID